MSSSRLARLSIALLVLGASTGCRDLTLPEPADPIVADLSLYIVGLGTDGPLAGSTVVIDNSSYVEPEFAGAWTAVSAADGIARFSSRLLGTYDVFVSSGDERQTAPGRATPAWTAHAVDVGDGSAVVAYPGLPVEARFDWPELSDLGISPSGFEVLISYAVEEFHFASQTIAHNGEGVLVGMIPWAGEFGVRISVLSDRFSLIRYGPRGRFHLEAGSVISVPSPLHDHAVEVFADGSPLEDATVEVVHDTEWMTTDPHYRLIQVVDVQQGQAQFFLMEPVLSVFQVRWLEGPRFLTHRMFLSEENRVPGPINLGDHTVTINIVDESGLSVPGARMSISDGAVEETWWDEEENAAFVCFLNPATYRVEAWAGTTLRSSAVPLDLDRDLELDITLLDQEAP